MRTAIREAKYTTRYRVNAIPGLYMPLARIRHRHQSDWCVRRDTELVVEGFGRSGSTFAVDAFEMAQSRTTRLAHHSHAAAQVLTAARLGVPTVLIVRHPSDVVPSHMLRRGIGAKAPLVAWVRFHETVVPVRERMLVVSFEEMTKDMGSVIRRVNARFNTSFAVFEHTPENEARVFERIEQRNQRRFGTGTEEGSRSLARPTVEREERKGRLRADYEAPALRPLRDRAERAYRLLLPDGP